MTSLGSYLLISMVFVFFPLVEFAILLIFKEVNERQPCDTVVVKDQSKSIKKFLGQITELQTTDGKVASLQEITETQKFTLSIDRPGFFKNLPLVRRLDVLAFVIYNFSYLIYNCYYWNNVHFKR